MMAGHIFWDNMMFISHPLIGTINVPNTSLVKARPTLWSNDGANQEQKNFRVRHPELKLNIPP